MASSHTHLLFTLSQHPPCSLTAPFFVPHPQLSRLLRTLSTAYPLLSPAPFFLQPPFLTFRVHSFIQAPALGFGPHILVSFPCPLTSFSSSPLTNVSFHQQVRILFIFPFLPSCHCLIVQVLHFSHNPQIFLFCSCSCSWLNIVSTTISVIFGITFWVGPLLKYQSKCWLPQRRSCSPEEASYWLVIFWHHRLTRKMEVVPVPLRFLKRQ